MKRGRTYVTKSPYSKRQKTQVVVAKQLPRRAYAGSMVPMRTGGYRPNVVERKVNDVATATYNVSTTGSFTLLAGPVLGSDFNQRIGRKILLKSAYIRGRVQLEAANGGQGVTGGAQLARMILVCDLQPNGAAPAVTDLLVEALPSSQLNLNNRDRFKILADKQYYVDPYINITTATQSQAALGKTGYAIKKYKKINIEMIFNATNGGTIADVNSGALYMFWIGSGTAGSNTDINAIVSTRVRYVDS